MKQPQFELKGRESWREERELLVLGFFEGEEKKDYFVIPQIYDQFPSLKDDFKGKAGQKVLIHLPPANYMTKKVLFVGLGKEEEFDLEQHRELSAQVACYVRDLGIKSFSVEVFGDSVDPERVRATVEGMGLGLYQFQNYKKASDDSPRVERINLLVDLPIIWAGGELLIAADYGKALVESVYLVRDLVNEPPNVMTPRKLSFKARETANNSQGKIRIEVLDEEDLEDLGMNLILAVGRGSSNEPCLIKMEYKPDNAQNPDRPYVLVGKAVCFDSGGLDIKPAGQMGDMKGDMAGGAAVLGTLKAIADLNLPFWVIGLIPAVENMPSGTSYRPGDILKAYNNKTIEIIDTDAEGRLVIFDAMAYAKEKYNPLLVVDIATLTGACVVALGYCYAGLMGNSPEFIEKFKAAGEQSGDKVWQLPIVAKRFLKEMEGKITDLINYGPRWGAAIHAACFLQEAVGKEQPWAHIDCAGPAYLEKGGSRPAGGTGFGVRLFVQFFINQIKP